MSIDNLIGRVIGPVAVAIAIALTFLTFAGYWA
jgi:hypothetical protein